MLKGSKEQREQRPRNGELRDPHRGLGGIPGSPGAFALEEVGSRVAPPSLTPWNQPQLSAGTTQLRSYPDTGGMGIPQPNRIQHTEHPGPAQLSVTTTPHIKPRCLRTSDGL